MPHPFYQFVANFLSGNPLSSEKSPKPNPDFWGKNPIKEIIFATGSTRKALVFSLALNEIEWPFREDPLAYQEFLTKNIQNGDGSLQQKTLLGYLQGVPVYAQSAAPGESAANDPRQEAINKAQWLADQSPYKDNENYLVFTTDTVDFPDKNGNGQLDEGSEGLGKPLNDCYYPQPNQWMVANNQLLRLLGEQVYRWQVKNFDQKYVRENYQAGIELIHVNSVALLSILAQGEPTVVKTWDVIIRKLITSDFLVNTQVYPDQGGGGATQQNQNWQSPEEIFATLDNETQALLSSYFETDPDFFKMLVMFQIAGVPTVSILQAIEQWATDLVRREAVVFKQENQ